MPIPDQRQQAIEHIIKEAIRRKLRDYKPETKHMPFHYRLLGRDRMALFSFIHSVNTTIGISIFEPIAVRVASEHFADVQMQYDVGDQISTAANAVISEITNDLSAAYRSPDIAPEVMQVREVCREGQMQRIKPMKVDLYLRSSDGTVYLFDLKTAKPNKSDFRKYKRTLLEWTAISLNKDPLINVVAGIAIPYNPHFPKPYERWTAKGMLDLNHQLKVGNEFWDFIGGVGCYNELLECFEKVGNDLRSELDDYCTSFHDT